VISMLEFLIENIFVSFGRRVNSFTIFLLYLFYCRSRSGFGRIFCSAFETVCASSLATCAYQIGEHLHLTFADHLDLYNQQANPNFRFRSEQIPNIPTFSVQGKSRSISVLQKNLVTIIQNISES
jgi:hypothetical protein